MDHTSIDVYLVIDTFLLLLFGIGPKIALVPFLEVTAAIDGATKALVVRKMLITAGVVAVILVGLGELLARLLHFSTGSLSIAGGVILDHHRRHHGARDRRPAGQPGHQGAATRMRIAVFPLAVPVPPQPGRGSSTLVTLSAEADSIGVVAMVLGGCPLVVLREISSQAVGSSAAGTAQTRHGRTPLPHRQGNPGAGGLWR